MCGAGRAPFGRFEPFERTGGGVTGAGIGVVVILGDGRTVETVRDG